jgi:hypothetical protein
MAGVRLEWEGKGNEVLRLRLPIQIVETVNAPRADRGTLFDGSTDTDDSGWRNKLIWGDNLQVLTSLADELAGQVDLIYIDPPFDSRQDYKVRISVGDGEDCADQELTKLSSIIEEKAYRDTWGRGVESYLDMLYQRLVILRCPPRSEARLRAGRIMSTTGPSTSTSAPPATAIHSTTSGNPTGPEPTAPWNCPPVMTTTSPASVGYRSRWWTSSATTPPAKCR